MLETMQDQEVSEEVVTEEVENTGSQESINPPADSKPSEVDLLKREIEKLKKVTVDRGAHINKLRTQLSELKSSASKSAKEAQEIKDEDPLRAAEKVFDSKQAEKQAKDIEREIEFNETVAANKQVVLSKFPDFMSMIDDACKILAEDNIDEQSISEFRQNPYTTSAGVLVNLARAVKTNREKEDLKRRLDSASSHADTVLKDIETKANRKVLNNISGGGSANTGSRTFMLDKPVEQMTREERAQLREKLKERD